MAHHPAAARRERAARAHPRGCASRPRVCRCAMVDADASQHRQAIPWMVVSMDGTVVAFFAGALCLLTASSSVWRRRCIFRAQRPHDVLKDGARTAAARATLTRRSCGGADAHPRAALGRGADGSQLHEPLPDGYRRRHVPAGHASRLSRPGVTVRRTCESRAALQRASQIGSTASPPSRERARRACMPFTAHRCGEFESTDGRT